MMGSLENVYISVDFGIKVMSFFIFGGSRLQHLRQLLPMESGNGTRQDYKFTTWMWKSNLSSYKNHQFFLFKRVGFKKMGGEKLLVQILCQEFWRVKFGSGAARFVATRRCSPLRGTATGAGNPWTHR